MSRKVDLKLTAIDKAVAWLNPEAGLRRARARFAMGIVGGYAGAIQSCWTPPAR